MHIEFLLELTSDDKITLSAKKPVQRFFPHFKPFLGDQISKETKGYKKGENTPRQRRTETRKGKCV